MRSRKLIAPDWENDMKYAYLIMGRYDEKRTEQKFRMEKPGLWG